MSAPSGSSVEALFVVAALVWVAAVVLFCTHGIEALSRAAERRDIRRERRETVRAVRNLGGRLLVDELAARRVRGDTR